MLTIRRRYRVPPVVQEVVNMLATAGFAISTSIGPKDFRPAPRLVVVLDGWGQMNLAAAFAALRGFLRGAVILAITTDEREDIARLLELGFQDCVSWPRDADTLNARARARLRDAEPFVRAEVSLDPARLALQCNGALISLTRNEFRIVGELLKSPEDWCHTRRLREVSVGEQRAGVTPVSHHIHALRQKLRDEAWRIRSHRTLGYFFDASQPRRPQRLSAIVGDGAASKN